VIKLSGFQSFISTVFLIYCHRLYTPETFFQQAAKNLIYQKQQQQQLQQQQQQLQI
jgi:hypothetical protein